MARKRLEQDVRPRLRPAGLGWINFAVLRRSHSTLHKQRKSDLKVIADQQGHGMRTASGGIRPERFANEGGSAKLYADFLGCFANEVNRGTSVWRVLVNH